MITIFDVNETLCPKQMLVHKGGQIMNWCGEFRDVIHTKLRAKMSKSAKGDYWKKIKITFFLHFHHLIYSSSSITLWSYYNGN